MVRWCLGKNTLTVWSGWHQEGHPAVKCASFMDVDCANMNDNSVKSQCKGDRPSGKCKLRIGTVNVGTMSGRGK